MFSYEYNQSEVPLRRGPQSNAPSVKMLFFFHGHDYEGTLTLGYKAETELGYSIDFAVIKQLFCTYIDNAFDHGFIANSEDAGIIELCRREKTKLFIMPGKNNNPSAENIAKVLFYASEVLLKDQNLHTHSVTLYETPNCFTVCDHITEQEQAMFASSDFHRHLLAFKNSIVVPKYDRAKMSVEELQECLVGEVVGTSTFAPF